MVEVVGPNEAGNILVHLRPFFVFSNLTDLECSGVPFALDDSTMRDMAVAWPRLRSLALEDNLLDPRITILGLVPLAQHCSELQTLKIRFDARSLPALVPNTLAARNETMEELDVSLSPIAEPEWVAAFLYDIFPGTRLVGIDLGEFQAEWEQVSTLMHAFGVYECWRVEYHTNPT
jgi:hypothetical protein